MGLKEFRNKIKRNLMPELKEQPMQYWEEMSFMIVIPMENDDQAENEFVQRIAALPDVNVIKSRQPEADNPGLVRFEYRGKEYTAGFRAADFSLPDVSSVLKQSMSSSETEALEKADRAMTVFMRFEGQPQECYHLQLRLCCAAFTSIVAVMDESAEQMLSGRWVRMAAASTVLPSSTALYTVQAISGENGSVWLHTHGLCRCGITELEILESDAENADNHFQIIKALAGRLIGGDKGDMGNDVYYIGMIGDEIPVVATYRSWTTGLAEYNNPSPGGVGDRQDGHNSRTSLVFLYRGPKDQEKGVLSKVSLYDGLWADNAMFFIGKKETERMSALARERYSFLRKAAGDSNNKILLKLGLPTDEKYRNEDGGNDYEHIWFEALSFDDNGFSARLTQKPYYIDGLDEGYIGNYTCDDITDWVIGTPEQAVTPDNIYLLEE